MTVSEPDAVRRMGLTRRAISYLALGLGVVVLLVTLAVSVGYLSELFGGDFLNVGLFGLGMALLASLAIWTAANRADRFRAIAGVVLCCIPIALLAYFLAFTVD